MSVRLPRQEGASVGNSAEFAQAHEVILQTHACFAALVRGAACGRDGEPDLGGRLFWAGDLDETGRALAMAANVAGAATLVSTPDQEAQRHAVRAGVVDFLVISLDEALRILKNEIRKRAAVAVCVGASRQDVEGEMARRGIEPDLFREEVVRASLQERAERGTAGDAGEASELVAWRVASAPAVWLPKLDAMALACLRPEEVMARRWIRLSARYLGRLGHAEHLVWSDGGFRTRLVARLREESERGALAVRGEVETSSRRGRDRFVFGTPPASS